MLCDVLFRSLKPPEQSSGNQARPDLPAARCPLPARTRGRARDRALPHTSAFSKQATIVLQKWRNSQVRKKNDGMQKRARWGVQSRQDLKKATREKEKARPVRDCLLVAKRASPNNSRNMVHRPRVVDCLNIEAEGQPPFPMGGTVHHHLRGLQAVVRQALPTDQRCCCYQFVAGAFTHFNKINPPSTSHIHVHSTLVCLCGSCPHFTNTKLLKQLDVYSET